MTGRNGIPTSFLGCKFRSRLEAKWAAFFYLAGWEWEYEPFDLDGYIPDFVLHGRCEWNNSRSYQVNNKIVPILVEIKPVLGIHDRLFRLSARKIEKAWEGDAVILSYFLPLDCGIPTLGWIREGWQLRRHRHQRPKDYWSKAVFQESYKSPAIFGFCHNEFSYHDRISGFNPGRCGGTQANVMEFWREAGNIVQWQGAT